jgi:ABC-type Mn2+/Zn2+ transport system ATPase subunit
MPSCTSGSPAVSDFVLRTPRLRAARGVTVATDVALAASAGEVIAVEGPNGSGKSTLLAAAAGLLPTENATVRPATVGFSPERATLLPRITVLRWLTGLARTAGLSRADSAAQTRELMRRLGLEPAATRPMHVLSRGNTQRVLVAQALVGDPALVILDEPSGGLDADGVARVAAEIVRAASRGGVVLVARHPTAPLPLPAGTTWRFGDGTVRTLPRPGGVPATAPSPAGLAGPTSPAGPAEPASPAGPAGPAGMEVETGDGVVRRVTEAELPGVLRAALDAGVPVRRVQPIPSSAPVAPAIRAEAGAVPPRRAGALTRVLYGAAHRARLLAVSQWFAAPMLVFLAVLAIIYASDAGPPLQPAAVTSIALVPVMMWLTVLAHRVDGRELARAFAAHVGGRARAHLATDLCLVPFAVTLVILAVVWPLVGQGSHQHPPGLLLRMTGLHLAAALFGIGLGSALALIERIGWRLIVAIAVFLGLVIVRDTPMVPLLRLSTAAVNNATPVGTQALWLCVPGVALVAAAAYLATRVL